MKLVHRCLIILLMLYCIKSVTERNITNECIRNLQLSQQPHTYLDSYYANSNGNNSKMSKSGWWRTRRSAWNCCLNKVPRTNSELRSTAAINQKHLMKTISSINLCRHLLSEFINTFDIGNDIATCLFLLLLQEGIEANPGPPKTRSSASE